MRILWFSNTPSLAASKVSKDTVGCSWIESLERELCTFPDIELAIAFKKLVKEPQEIKIENSNTRYFMLPEYPNGKIDQWMNRLLARRLSTKSLVHYLKVVEEFKPDVILFFGTEFDFPLIIPELKVPSIIWFQGNLTVYKEMYENGIRIHKTFAYESLKRVLKCYTIYHTYRIFSLKVKREKKIFSFAKNFIGRTDWDRRLVRIMAPEANYFHSEEALRPSFWKYQWSPHKNHDKYIVTTVIRGQLYKGLETIYKTAGLLSATVKKDFEWHVIGITEGTTYEKAARMQANNCDIDSRVKLLGPKFGDDLVQQLLKADVYVHPSHIENSSNAIQEAMLLGMPVVATNVGGTPSLITDHKEGLLVQSKDQYAMAGAIIELLESPEKSKEMGFNARLLGLKRNDNKKICEELIKTFKKVVKENKFKSI